MWYIIWGRISSGNPVVITTDGSISTGGGNNSTLISMASGTGTGHVYFNQAGNNNYNAATEVTEDVTAEKADATIDVKGYTGVYDGAAHGATGTATGVGGVDLSAGLDLGLTFTNYPGGTASWTFTGGTNYNDESGSVDIVISKADATVTVSGYSGVYDGAAHGATGTATGVAGVDLSAGLDLGLTFTNYPGGTASWTFEGGTNPTFAVSHQNRHF